MADGCVCARIRAKLPWMPEPIENTLNLPHGDMPGDKIKINETHIEKACKIFPRLLELLIPVTEENFCERAVVSICGGSGVGKSEIASLLAHYIGRMGIGGYILSGDNYPHRIPMHNDVERLRIFRYSGIRGLISGGYYSNERYQILKELQKKLQTPTRI